MKDIESKDEDIIYNEDINIYWTPEDYGFEHVEGIRTERGARWEKGKFILIRLSETLWVLKKNVGTITTENGKKAKLVTKWHLVIDRKNLADIYFTSALRG